MTAAIELEGITKRFPGVIANDNVNLTVEQGEIHAICGENGAGKSTLMKILYGMQPPDEGVMKVKGQVVEFSSPTDAIAMGIGMVHQHFMLADQLTVLENVILGAEPVIGGVRIDFKEAEEHLEQVAADYGLDIDVHQDVETLEVGERQRVEIIKVLYRGAQILILDEPTAVLVPQEVEALFDNMRELKANGATILFIDHKLDEVLEIADSITVLRQGRTVATLKNEGVTAADLAELMVGSELPTPETTESTVTDEVALQVRNLSVAGDDAAVVDDERVGFIAELIGRFTSPRHGEPLGETHIVSGDDRTRRRALDDVSLTIHRGEILGIAGVEGNGQGELVDAIIGTAEIAGGTIELFGEDITKWSVRRRREAGIGYVPEDRHEEGLLLSSPLWENAALGHQTQAPFGSRWLIDRAGGRRQTERIRKEFDVRTPSIEVAAHALSGGNQQKLIIGRELVAEPRVLIASHPTRGIDVGAQAAVWDQMRHARSEGLATLLISADLDELIGLSDTIVVMLRGRLVARLSPDEVTPRDLGAYMTGAATQDGFEQGAA